MYKNFLIKARQEKWVFLYSLLCIFFLYLYLTDHELLTTSFLLFALFQAPQGKTIDQLKNEEYTNYQDKYREELKQDIEERKLNANNKTEDEEKPTPETKLSTYKKTSNGKASGTNKIQSLKKRGGVGRALSISLWGLGILYLFQFIFAILTLSLLASAWGVESIPVIGTWVATAAGWVFERLTRTNFEEIAAAFLAIAGFLGWIQMFILLLLFYLFGISSLGGKMLELKWIAFIGSLLLYLAPLINILPVGILWLLVVLIYPD